MKIKEGFVIRKVADKYMVVATGEASKSFHGMISLNETAALIWNGLAAGNSVESIASELSVQYNISEEKALSDINELIEKMNKAGILC